MRGDRYELGTGTYSATFLGEPGKGLTMVSADGVEAQMAQVGMEPLPLSELRRNIVIRGLGAEDVNEMVGHEVSVGSCRVFVHRRSVPCRYREAHCGRGGMMDKLWDVCGVNCEILVGGDVHVGDAVSVVPGSHQPERCNPGRKPPGFFVRPSDRTLEQRRAMAIPPFVAAVMCAIDPEGFERIERAYAFVGLRFWSAEAYAAGACVKRLRGPLGCLAVAVAAGTVVAILMRGRR